MDELVELLLVAGSSELLAALHAAALNATLRDRIPVPAIKFNLRELHPAKARFRLRFELTRTSQSTPSCDWLYDSDPVNSCMGIT
jgi:hypothetical protein